MIPAICIIAAWVIVAFAVAPRLGRIIAEPEPFTDDEGTRWISVLPPVPPARPLPDESPLDLTGYALDAKFYAVVAPSFGEYR